jgi:hypothetical protein
MEFRFTRRPTGGPPHGFDLGDITVIGARGEVTSAGHQPDQGMMIYLSVTGLLDGLRSLLGAGRGTYEFVGVDSSFTLEFTLRRDQLTVRTKRTEIDSLPARDVISAVWSAARAIAADPLPEGDAAGNDVAAALRDFEKLVRN